MAAAPMFRLPWVFWPAWLPWMFDAAVGPVSVDGGEEEGRKPDH
jgi:hypothetical protein